MRPPKTHVADKRQLLKGLALGAVSTMGLSWLGLGKAENAPTPSRREIDVIAQRFRFTPSDIRLRAGEPVVLAVRSLDFVHGLSIPDLGLRTDLMPGKVTRIDIPALPAGTVDFLCDNFCGDGHEEMHGRLVIEA